MWALGPPPRRRARFEPGWPWTLAEPSSVVLSVLGPRTGTRLSPVTSPTVRAGGGWSAADDARDRIDLADRRHDVAAQVVEVGDDLVPGEMRPLGPDQD